MMYFRFTLPAIFVVAFAWLPNAAFADPPDFRGVAGADAYEIVGDQTVEGTRDGSGNPSSPGTPTGEATPAFVEYRWVIVCMNPASHLNMGAESDCSAAHVCSDPQQRLYLLWARRNEASGWRPLYSQCFGAAPENPRARPRITPALVLNELRRIGLPSLQARTQPEGKTLVNFDTIFCTEAHPFSATVRLLGQQVEIVAEPTEYVWHYGDGAIRKTASPGAPYPSKEITYRYSDAHTTVRPRVDVTYTARFRVNGGQWQAIPDTVSITGPEGTLRVSEAAPVLSGNYG